MRLVRFSAAMSLDGYIAGPQGEHDWIVPDPDVDFAAMMSRFDTYQLPGSHLDPGRNAHEVTYRSCSSHRMTQWQKQAQICRPLSAD